MREHLSIQDVVTIKVTRADPVVFMVYRPTEMITKIPKSIPYPIFRYDEVIEFHVTAHSQDEAESLIDTLLQ